MSLHAAWRVNALELGVAILGQEGVIIRLVLLRDAFASLRVDWRFPQLGHDSHELRTIRRSGTGDLATPVLDEAA